MKYIAVQLLDGTLSNDWWKQLVLHYCKEHAQLEIRMWNEETREIQNAMRYGSASIEGNETCVRGTVTAAFLQELAEEQCPADREIYHKMTQYFTVRVTEGETVFESAHYGTELYLADNEEKLAAFWTLMQPYEQHFSIAVGAL